MSLEDSRGEGRGWCVSWEDSRGGREGGGECVSE